MGARFSSEPLHPSAEYDDDNNPANLINTRPVIDITRTFSITNGICMRPTSIQLVKKGPPGRYSISFSYDAEEPAMLSMYFVCFEIYNSQSGILSYEKISDVGPKNLIARLPTRQGGLYTTPPAYDLDFRKYSAELFDYRNELMSIPIVIKLTTQRNLRTRVCELSLATIVRSADDSIDKLEIRVYKQKLLYGKVLLEIQPIYGMPAMEAARAPGVAEEDCATGKECVVCLTSKKRIAILPCRHLCLCSDCAAMMRSIKSRCPICRQRVKGLLEVQIRNPD